MTGLPPDLLDRLWRARRRHHHLDAILQRADAGWTLTFLYDNERLMAWSFDTREAGVAEADRRLRDLLRAGWNLHW